MTHNKSMSLHNNAIYNTILNNEYALLIL